MIKRKLPHARVPVLNKDGTMARDWFQQLESMAFIGGIEPTAGGGLVMPPAGAIGFVSVIVADSVVKIPVYAQ